MRVFGVVVRVASVPLAVVTVPAVLMQMLRVRLRAVGALVDPALDIGSFLRGIEQRGAEQGVGRNLAVRHAVPRRSRIERN